MRTALGLAARGLGQVAPNPAVGCVIVRPDLEDRVVGRGWTQPGGRPHAETEALRRAGRMAEGATAYVSLEPCSHIGQTGPCAEALIEARISRVVIALVDPDPRVTGRGIQKLQDANIDVSMAVLGDQATRLNNGFIYKIQRNRPFYSWKTATSLDGKIATASGHSKWITGDDARRRGHLLRARHDAILTGVGTAVADDPDLTCRLPGLSDHSPVRIVVDSQLRLPAELNLVRTARTRPTWVITTPDASPENEAALAEHGVSVFRVARNDLNQVDIKALSRLLVDQEMTRVLIEGGSAIASSFLKENLVDQIYWFRAPKIIGSDGMPAINGLDILQLEDTTPYIHRRSYAAGQDRLDIFDLESSKT